MSSSTWLPRDTDIKMPHDHNNDTSDEPPTLKNGTGTPVNGIIDNTDNVFISVCKSPRR